jgi:hypothetical protein
MNGSQPYSLLSPNQKSETVEYRTPSKSHIEVKNELDLVDESTQSLTQSKDLKQASPKEVVSAENKLEVAVDPFPAQTENTEQDDNKENSEEITNQSHITEQTEDAPDVL